MEYEINGLLDRIKSEYHIGSDYKLAQFLGVVNGSIRHYRHGRSLPDLRVTERIAFSLKIDPDVLWAQFQAQRAPDPHAAETWTRIAKRLQEAGISAVVTVAGVAIAAGFITTPPNAEAVVTELKPANSSGLYIMFSYLRRRLRAFLRTTRGQVIGKLAGPQQHRESHVSCAWPAAPALALAR